MIQSSYKTCSDKKRYTKIKSQIEISSFRYFFLDMNSNFKQTLKESKKLSQYSSKVKRYEGNTESGLIALGQCKFVTV